MLEMRHTWLYQTIIDIFECTGHPGKRGGLRSPALTGAGCRITAFLWQSSSLGLKRKLRNGSSAKLFEKHDGLLFLLKNIKLCFLFSKYALFFLACSSPAVERIFQYTLKMVRHGNCTGRFNISWETSLAVTAAVSVMRHNRGPQPRFSPVSGPIGSGLGSALGLGLTPLEPQNPFQY